MGRNFFVGLLLSLSVMSGFGRIAMLSASPSTTPSSFVREAGIFSLLKDIFKSLGVSDDPNNYQLEETNTNGDTTEWVYVYTPPPPPRQAEVIEPSQASQENADKLANGQSSRIDRHTICRVVKNQCDAAGNCMINDRSPTSTTSAETSAVGANGWANTTGLVNAPGPGAITAAVEPAPVVITGPTQPITTPTLQPVTAIFIPWRSREEWASFVANPPKQAEVETCPPPAPPPSSIGCYNYVVPAGVTRLRIIAIGGGGAGQRTTPGCAYRMLAGASGATIHAEVTVTPGESIPYCVGTGGRIGSGLGWSTSPRNCGATIGDNSRPTYFGEPGRPYYIFAGAGANGNAWHYKNEDRRGTPPSAGGTVTLGSGVRVADSRPGQSVTSLGACGGTAYIPKGTTIPSTELNVSTGAGSCSMGEGDAKLFGAGGYATPTSHYSAGGATNGADGYLLIEPL